MTNDTNKTDNDTASTHPDDHSLEGDDIWGDSSSHPTQGEEETKEDGDIHMKTEDETVEFEAQHMSTDELRQRIHLLNNEIRIMNSDCHVLTFESQHQKQKIKENLERIKINTELPLLVSTIVEILPPEHNDEGNVKLKKIGSVAFVALFSTNQNLSFSNIFSFSIQAFSHVKKLKMVKQWILVLVEIKLQL